MRAQPNILVVDDDAPLRQMVSRILIRNGYSVDEARNGFDAIEKLTKEDYSAVILDLMMPIMNGFEVMAFMRRENVGVPCIVMTAAGPNVAPLLDPSIASHILEKPFGIQQLVSLLSRVMRRAEASPAC